MVKFRELSAKDKRNRYRNAVKIPAIFVLGTMIFAEAHYSALSTFLTLLMLVDLYCYGVLNNKNHYTHANVISDGTVLVTVNLLSAFIFSPVMVSALRIKKLFPFLDNRFDFANFIMTIVLIYVMWYAAVIIQDKLTKKPAKWKWEITNLFSSVEKYFN